MGVSRNRSNHRYRCSRGRIKKGKKCGKRFKVKADVPKHSVRCPFCGTDKVYSTEASRRRQMHQQGRCTCNNVPFPHKPGFNGCVEGVDLDSEEAYEDWKTMILQDRSSFS